MHKYKKTQILLVLMKVTIDFRKSVEENAAEYFEKAKKSKKKLKGAKKALANSMKKLENVKNKEFSAEKTTLKKIKKREWFEKFRWFISSDNLLVIGGRDATTNEIAVKKHSEKEDLVFHTDMAGSPFIIVKSEGKKIPKTTIQEAADFTADFSRGWKKGLTSVDVFCVKPEQVSKETNPGEYMAKGSFMIRGKTTYVKTIINLAIGMHKNKIMSGPLSAIKKQCPIVIEIIQGREKTSDVAKKILRKIGGELDDIIRALPVGCDLKS